MKRPYTLAITIVVCARLCSAAAAAEPSDACALPDRLVRGDYTHQSQPSEVWEFKQPKMDGSFELRTFNIYVPTKHAERTPLPLVIELHGTNQGAWLSDRSSRMRERGEREGFIVLQPESLPAWTTTIGSVIDRKLSDVDFIAGLLARLNAATSKLCFDRKQIFVTGGSAGGSMATVLACASANDKLGSFKIAAIAPVIAAPAWPDMVAPICPTLKGDELALRAYPVPMRVIFSNNDKLVAFGFAGDNVRRLMTSVRRMVKAWADENGCKGEFTVEPTGRTGYGVLVETVKHGCANVGALRGDTMLDVFDTGASERSGHFLPGATGALPGEYDAASEIWNFFKSHPR